jgi:hypothetical protein
MSATNASPVYLNGHAPAYFQDTRSEETYGKIIQLYKDVISGTHPRLKMVNGAGLNESANASLQNGTSTPHTPFGANASAPNAFQFPPGLNNLAASSLSPSQAAPQSQHSWNNTAATPQHRQPAVASTPQFNPILLQKSDVLNKAEMKLKEQRRQQASQEKLQADRLQELKNSRHRIEGILHQELQARESNKDMEDTNQYNVADALTKAQLKVPPISGIKSPTPVPAVDASSESFDENSYYSSKANTWSTEHSDPQPDPNDPDPDAMSLSDADDDLYEEYEPPAQIAVDTHQAIGGAELQQQQVTAIPGLGDDMDRDDLDEQWEPEWDEEEEDDDYEPPAPHAFEEPAHSSARNQPIAHQHNHHRPSASDIRPQARQPQHVRNASGNGIRSPISVAVNHIPTPVAPQPSRISPLAMGNTFREQGSSVRYGQASAQASGYNGSGRVSGNDSRRPSPNATKGKGKASRRATAYATGSTKRKRGGSPEGQSAKRKKPKQRLQPQAQPQPQPQPLMSPEPYIKPEPVSPTGFGRAEYAPSRRTSYREAPDALMASPRIARPRSAYYEYDQSPRGYRSADDLDRTAMPPPAAYRRPERDNQDLRRVASLQNARRLPSPGYAPYAEPAPYEVIERPYAREPVYRESSVRPEGARYVRAPRSPSPPRAVDPYARVRSPALMPPPPARPVIVDEYGTRYYAEPAPVDYRLAAPRRPEIDPHYERASTRAPIRVADPYEEDPYRGMPPPPRARAYSRVPEAEIVDHRVRERAFSVRPQVPAEVVDRRERAFSVHPQAAPARSMRGFQDHDDEFARPPPPRFDDPPREYVPRAFSVHPEAPRAPEYVSRPSSVHPEAYARRGMPPPPISREQVVVDDGYGGRYAPPASRYADEVEPAEETPYGDGRRVVSYRY